jgi:Ca2+-binding EF-hand superfamily protein
MLASVIGIVNPGTAASAILGILVCFIFCHVFEKRPFKEDDDNELGVVLAWSLTLFFLSAICIKADVTQDSGDEQKVFGIALTVILATGPALIVVQTANAIFMYLTTKPASGYLDESGNEEKVNTLQTRQRQVPIALYKNMGGKRGNVLDDDEEVLDDDEDVEAGGKSVLIPKRLVENRNDDVQLKDLPGSVSENWQGRSSSSGTTDLDIEDSIDPLAEHDVIFTGVSLDTGDPLFTARRKSFTEADLEAILLPNVEKVSLRQRLAARLVSLKIDESETEHAVNDFKTRLTSRELSVPKPNNSFSPKESSRPSGKKTKEEEEQEEWAALPPPAKQVERSFYFGRVIDVRNGGPEALYEAKSHEEAEVKAKYLSMLQSHAVDVLDRCLFKELINALLQEGMAETDLPSDQDLMWAFEVADTDQSGNVDEDKFVALYRLANAGQVKGLGKASMFSTRRLDFKRSFEAATLPTRLPRSRRRTSFRASKEVPIYESGTVPAFLASIKMDAFWPEFEKRGYTMFGHFIDPKIFSDDELNDMGMGKVKIQFFRRLLRHGAAQNYFKANGAAGENNELSAAEVKTKYLSMLQSHAVDVLDRSMFKELITALLQEGMAEKDLPSDQDLNWAFEVADTDQSGYVVGEELLILYKVACAGQVNGLSKASLFSTKKADFKKSLVAAGLSKRLTKSHRKTSFRASKEAPSYEDGTVLVSAPYCRYMFFCGLYLFCSQLRACMVPHLSSLYLCFALRPFWR